MLVYMFIWGGEWNNDVVPVNQIVPAALIWRERRIVPATTPNFVGWIAHLKLGSMQPSATIIDFQIQLILRTACDVNVWTPKIMIIQKK